MPRDAGYIYAIQAEGTPYVKIWRTRRTVEKRVLALQTSQPFRLKIIACIHLENLLPATEQQIHRLLASYRRHGEWFELALDAAQFVQIVEEAAASIVPSIVDSQDEEFRPLLPFTPLGKRIDALRREHDWTWKALARRAGLHPQGLYKITHGERHDPRLSAMVGIARAFGMTVSEMLADLEETMTTTDNEEEHEHAA